MLPQDCADAALYCSQGDGLGEEDGRPYHRKLTRLKHNLNCDMRQIGSDRITICVSFLYGLYRKCRSVSVL